MGLLTNQALSSAGPDKVKNGLANQTQHIQQRGGIQSVNVLSANEVGQIAELSVQILYGDQFQQTVNVKLIKEDRQWKIDAAK